MESPNFLVFRRGIVYEGTNEKLWALFPIPLVSPVKSPATPKKYVFREDLCDLSTQTRRGRFYSSLGGFGCHWDCSIVSNNIYWVIVGCANNQFIAERIYTIADTDHIESREIIQIGDGTKSSSWKIIDIEKNIFGQNVFTLRKQDMLE